MRDKLMRNFFWKLLAGVLAVVVWLIVNNIDDPRVHRTFKNISVELQNEQAIASLDKVYEVMSGGTVNVTVYGKQSVVRKITADDIVATADLSQLSLTYAASIQLSCPKYENVELQSDMDMLCISLEEKKIKRCGVSVQTYGNPAEGHALGDIKKSVAAIEVSGPKSVVERVETVKVELSVEGVSDDFSTRLVPKAYDANDRWIDTDALNFSVQKIKVSVLINDTKIVPVKIVTHGEPAAGYHVISAETNPATIEVTGEDAVLQKCSSVSIGYDITSSNADIYEEVTLADQLTEGISVVDDSISTINVLITISKQKVERVLIPLEKIELRNLSEGYETSFNGSNTTIEIQASWTSSEQSATMSSEDFKAYVDCSGLKEGTHTLQVQFENNEKIRIETSAKVRLNIKSIKIDEKKENEEKVTPTPESKATHEPEEKVEGTTEPTVEPTEATEDSEEEKEKKVGNGQD